MKLRQVFLGYIRHMRRDNGVIQNQQRMILGQRLLIIDIQGRAGDTALTQDLQQRGLVNDGAARGVDQLRFRFHRGKVIGADQAAAAFRQY